MKLTLEQAQSSREMLQRKYNHRNMEIPALTLRQNTDRLCRRTEDASLDKENGGRRGWGGENIPVPASASWFPLVLFGRGIRG